MKKIYTVYNGNIESAEVYPWGKGYKTVDSHLGLAFGCRSRVQVGDFAESELEAWERFRQQQCDLVANAHETIRKSLERMKMADEKIAALKA